MSSISRKRYSAGQSFFGAPSPEWRGAGMTALFDVSAGVDVIAAERSNFNAAGTVAGLGGIAGNFVGSTMQQYAHRSSYVLNGAMSIVVFMGIRNLSSYSEVISKTSISANGYNLRLGETSASDNSISLITYSGGAVGVHRVISGSTGLVPSTRPYVLVVTRGSGVANADDRVAYVNGIRMPMALTHNGTSGVATDGGDPVRIGRRADGGTNFDGLIYHLGLFNRALTEAEVSRITARPWSLFRQPRQRSYFIGDTASGPTVLIGSPSSQSATSGTASTSQQHALSGATSSQSAVATAVAVSQTHTLQGSSSQSLASSSSAAITQQHVLSADGSNQAAVSAAAAATQAHALTGAGASQSAQATSLAVSQVHALQGSPSVSVGTSSTGTIGSSVVLTGLDVSQANQSSAGSISQVAQLSGANANQSANAGTGAISVDFGLVGTLSSQANQSSAASITQTHSLIGAISYQSNASSIGNISGDVALGASTSVQFATSGTAAITQNQTLFGVGSSQGSAAVSAAISQTQKLFGSVSVQSNQSLANALTQIHSLSAALSTQNAFSGQGFVTLPDAGDFTDYIKNRLFVIGRTDTTFVIKRGGTQFIIER